MNSLEPSYSSFRVQPEIWLKWEDAPSTTDTHNISLRQSWNYSIISVQAAKSSCPVSSSLLLTPHALHFHRARTKAFIASAWKYEFFTSVYSSLAHCPAPQKALDISRDIWTSGQRPNSHWESSMPSQLLHQVSIRSPFPLAPQIFTTGTAILNTMSDRIFSSNENSIM